MTPTTPRRVATAIAVAAAALGGAGGWIACGGSNSVRSAYHDTPYFVARGRYAPREALPAATDDGARALRDQGWVDIGTLYVDGTGAPDSVERLFLEAAARRGAERVQVLQRGAGFLPKANWAVGGVLWRHAPESRWAASSAVFPERYDELMDSHTAVSFQTLDVQCRAGHAIACATIAAALGRKDGRLRDRLWSYRLDDYLTRVMVLATWHCERADTDPYCRFGAQAAADIATPDVALAVRLARIGCDGGDAVACELAAALAAPGRKLD